MIIAFKLVVLAAIVGGCVSVTRSFLAERAILSESGVKDEEWALAVALVWLCVWVPVAVLYPNVGAFLLSPLPFGALLAIPAIAMLRHLRQMLERRWTDRTRKVKDASDRGLLIGYTSAILAVLDWGFGVGLRALPSITGGQA